MLHRREWLAAAAGLGPAAFAQSRPASSAGRQVSVTMPQLEGIWQRDVDMDDVQALEYLTAFKVYPVQPTVDQVAWLSFAQHMLSKESKPNIAWRLYGLYHGTRTGLRLGDLLDAAVSLNFLPESRIVRSAGRLPAKLEPLFQFDRPLKEKAWIEAVVEDGARKPLGKPLRLPLERLEARELSLEFEAPSNSEVWAHFSLRDEKDQIFSEIRRPVLVLPPESRERIARLSAEGGKLVLRTAEGKALERIGSQTIFQVAQRYERAMSAYAVPYQERMHPFVARVMDGVVPRDWTPSVAGEQELAALETMAASLSAGRPPAPADFALRRLHWNFPSGENETFRVLYPDQFRPDRKWPVVVALHPEFGDEGSLAEMFLGPDGKTGLLAEEARKRGYLVLLPSAGSSYGWLLEPALTRLPQLVRQFCETWPVETSQVYLWGHSLGASLAFRMLNLRGIWAGAAMVAGRPHAKFDFNTPADIPVALIAGGSDPLMPPRQMLVISYRLQRAVKQREVITLDGQDHWSVGAAAIPAAFAFFDKVRQSKLP